MHVKYKNDIEIQSSYSCYWENSRYTERGSCHVETCLLGLYLWGLQPRTYLFACSL